MDLGEARNARGQDAESMSEDMARWRAELGEDFEQPERKGLDNLTEEEEAAVEWRTGRRPAYVLANHVFLEGKSQRHARDSLEHKVENLVKSWEMEASHKPRLEQWVTISDPGCYSVRSNDQDEVMGEAAARQGNYANLMRHCPLYHELVEGNPSGENGCNRSSNADGSCSNDNGSFGSNGDKKAQEESFEKSHLAFTKAFPWGFPWEVLRAFLKPSPTSPSEEDKEVFFSWRHWADFSGEFAAKKERSSKTRKVEMFGLTKAVLDGTDRVKSLEVFFDPESFLKNLNGDSDFNSSPVGWRKFLPKKYEDVLANFMTENGAGNSSKMLTDDELEKGLIGDYKTTALARAEKEGKKNPERVGGDEEAEKDRQR